MRVHSSLNYILFCLYTTKIQELKLKIVKPSNLDILQNYDNVEWGSGEFPYHFKHKSPYVAGWWRFPDVLHCQDVEADCLDVLIIFSMGI